MNYSISRQQLMKYASLTQQDMEQIARCRRSHNRLGFAYQLGFLRLMNRFPKQKPFEIHDDLLTFIGLQIGMEPDSIKKYAKRRETISEHQARIRHYLKKEQLDSAKLKLLEQFLFKAACRFDQIATLRSQAKQFLRSEGILQPAPSTLRRIIGRQRQNAKRGIFMGITEALSVDIIEKMDGLLGVEDDQVSDLQRLKEPPGLPSAASAIKLTDKLGKIQETGGVLQLDLSWVHNNYQRTMTQYARGCSAHRLRGMEPSHRYTVLTCLLRQTYQETVDQLIDMYDKLITRVHNHAQKDVDEHLKKQRNVVHDSLSMLQTVAQVILNDEIDDTEIRRALFSIVPKADLASQVNKVQETMSGKRTQQFSGILRRFHYLRRFTPVLLKYLEFEHNGSSSSSLLGAVEILKETNRQNKRRLPEDIPTDFVPAKLRPLVESDGTINKRAWECVLLTKVRDEIKTGNIAVKHSRRFGRFNDFLILDNQWEAMRDSFFQRAGLPACADEAGNYLKSRLNEAYDRFLQSQANNTYAKVNQDGWQLSTDPAESLSPESEARLAELRDWLSQRMRSIKLPALLIEVDNELHFTHQFMTLTRRRRQAEEICAVLATIMAHGCNIGPYTMSRLTPGVNYEQIRRITDWQLTEEAQRKALGIMVQAIADLDTSQTWGQGKTSSSDGQRFSLTRKVLQQTFSHRFRDFALEFYSFIADNYAPFYSLPIECTNRDAAYVLDGLLYNETDLPLEEHYTDTHGYTEVNFAAFAMLGKRFCPRIRGLHHQRIYCIDRERDYGVLSGMIKHSDRAIKLHWIKDQWDRMGQFYTSLDIGHTTASVALKRLASASKKNQFYRANRELGRIFKTEFILQYMSEPALRRRIRQGILKGEQLHALAREVFYGKRGRINAGDLYRQMNTCSCLTLILACIVYWQSKEIERVLQEDLPEADGIDISLLEHISPVEWDNVLLYGEYVIDRRLIH